MTTSTQTLASWAAADPFVRDALAQARCEAAHPQRYQPGFACHECELAMDRAAPLVHRVNAVVREEVAVEIERLCVESERAVGNPEYAAVRVDRLRELVAGWS